ncbi:DppD ABC-type dipeptide/oligopeptide/nickel transport system, ATPase component [Candidatus Nanopelagicaceae bacterium]|jgi:peptide/nickel transport system ATP-binding protein
MTQLLSIEDLHVSFPTEDGIVKAVDGVSLTVNSGETVAIVGESGSGKTVTSLSVMGLHKKGSVIIEGSIKINDGGTIKDVVNLSPNEVRDIRGRAVAMIFQDPMSSLHPYYKIGNQLAEAFEVHNPGNKKAAKARAIEMLDLVGISEPDQRAEEFPHQFSGGMRQRVMIAMALMNSPRLLIADEPTTALDVTVQAQILSLLDKLKKEFDMGVLLITHDLGVVAQVADRVSVMYAGQIVEEAPVDDLFYTPKAPYTVGLLKSVPRISAKNERLKAIPGQPPSLIHLPQGCDFSARCEYRNLSPVDCAVVPVSLHTDSAGHSSRCHIPIEVRNSVFAKDLQELK